MAIPTAAAMAQDLMDDLATLDPDGFGSLDTDKQEIMRDNLFTAVANLVKNTLENDAKVSFVAGDFAGTDSNGDTPDLITASGGTIT